MQYLLQLTIQYFITQLFDRYRLSRSSHSNIISFTVNYPACLFLFTSSKAAFFLTSWHNWTIRKSRYKWPTACWGVNDFFRNYVLYSPGGARGSFSIISNVNFLIFLLHEHRLTQCVNGAQLKLMLRESTFLSSLYIDLYS